MHISKSRCAFRLDSPRSRPRLGGSGVCFLQTASAEGGGNVRDRFWPALGSCAVALASRAPVDVSGAAVQERAPLWTAGLEQSLNRVAGLAATVLRVPSASVTPADADALPGLPSPGRGGDQRNPPEHQLCARVVGSR